MRPPEDGGMIGVIRQTHPPAVSLACPHPRPGPRIDSPTASPGGWPRPPARSRGRRADDGKGRIGLGTGSRPEPGKIKDGSSPAVACDHYRRFEADADLIRDLGLGHYRLSVAWPRVVPDGDGGVNDRGLDFYDRLIDALLARGVKPWVTLFHWDLPQPLEDKGGWTSRDTVHAYARYAEIVVKRLGDRVDRWFTMNEIPCFIGYGYGSGHTSRRGGSNRPRS